MGFRGRFETSYEKLDLLQSKIMKPMTLPTGNETQGTGVVSRIMAF